MLFVDDGSFECWMVLFAWFCSGGSSSLRWSTWFGACWITRLCVICFHQRGMIASKKLGQPYLLFARANCARTVSTFMCLFCFLSKNENNNGFDMICLNSSPFGYKRVANIRITVVFRIVFPS